MLDSAIKASEAEEDSRTKQLMNYDGICSAAPGFCPGLIFVYKNQVGPDIKAISLLNISS